MAAVTRLRGSERSAALALVAGVGAFALHNQIDWEWQQTALTAARLPDPRADRVRRGRRRWPYRPPRRGLAVLAATAFALAAIPVTLPVLSNRALARADRLENQGRVDEARVEADLAAALDRTSVDAQLERASLLQQLGRPADARRAVDHALSLAPEERPHLADAGRLPALLLERPRLAQEPRTARASWRATTPSSRAPTPRSIATPATPATTERLTRPAQVPRMTTSFAPLACDGVMPSNGVTNCTLPTSLASLRAAGP